MNILIIEDEKLASQKLEKMVLKARPEAKVLAKLAEVESAIAWFSEHAMPDLLFLDIHLLDGTCFDILKAVKIECPVIFTTAYEKYALDAFQVLSIDYLLKPVRHADLEGAFDKLDSIRTRLSENLPRAAELEHLIHLVENQNRSYKTRFLIKSGARLFPIATAQVGYFFSEHRITFLVTKEGNKYSINYTLDDLERVLDPVDFFRVNRQMILHIQSVHMVHKHFKGRLKVDLISTENSTEVMVSSRRVAEFQDWLDR